MTLLSTPLAGIDVDVTLAGTTTDAAGAAFPLGTKVLGITGIEYTYVQAGEAISTTTAQPYALVLDAAFQANKITKALWNKGRLFAVAPRIVISDNDFFWARTKGSVPLKVGVSAAADTALWTTATAGVIDDTSGATHVRVEGVMITVSASASASAGSTIRTAIITNPIVPGVIS